MKKIFLMASFAILFAAIGFFANQYRGGMTSSSSNRAPERAISSLTGSEKEIVSGINESILGVRTSAELKAQLKSLKATAAKHPKMNLVQIYYQALRPLEDMEGIIWRMRGVVEDCAVCHINALNFIKNFFYKDYMYGPHIKAMRDYIVDPPANATGKEDLFDSVSDFQKNYLETLLIPTIRDSVEKMLLTLDSMEDDFHFQFDNRLLTGHDNGENGEPFTRFISTDKVEKTVVKGNFYYMIARRQRFLGFLNFSVNYNFDDLPNYVNAFVKKTGLNTIISKLTWGREPGIKNNTHMDFVPILNGYPNLGKLHGGSCTKRNKAFLRASFYNFFQVQVNRLKATNLSLAHSVGDSDSYLMKPKVIAANSKEFTKTLNDRRNIWEKAFNTGKPTSMTDLLTGGQIVVNPAAFFNCHSNLQAFLPNDFDGDSSDETQRGTFSNTNRTVWKWNYDYGKAQGFKDPTFGGLLPEATKENFYTIFRSFRTNPATRRMATVLPFL